MTSTTIDTATRSTRLGTSLAGVETLTDALDVAGLNWGLSIRDAKNLAVYDEDGVTSTTIPGMRMVMRSDTNLTLGVVGGRYHAVDNRSAFGVATHLLGQGAVFSEGGELDHGRQVFIRMSLPGCNVPLIDGKDLIRANVLLKASHDGSGKVVARLELTRLVCTNGMTAKIKGSPFEFSIAHTASADQRLAEAHKIMDGSMRYAKAFAAACDHMLTTPMTLAQFRHFIDGMFPQPEVKEGDSTRATTIWENRRNALIDIFKFAQTNELGRNTAMGAYNSITEWVDWGMTVRSATEGDAQAIRSRRRFDLAGQDVKDQALALLS